MILEPMGQMWLWTAMADAQVGDEVHVDNRRFLAFCYHARHHLIDEAPFDTLRLDGQPVYPQHPAPLMSPLMGVCYSGSYEGKLMWIHHTRDSSVWAANGLLYAEAVHLAQGSLGAKANFRIRRNEHAEHGPPGIHSHRNGDKSSTLCRIPNLGQARVVVTNG